MRLSIRCITRVSLLAILCLNAQMSFAQGQTDLTIQAFSLSGSTTLSAGERIGSRLSATAYNAGSAPSSTFAVGFYLSQDSVITTNDTLLTGGREFESSLDNNGSRSIGIASVMSIPDDTAAGSYFLGVIIDELNTNEENDETNNTASFAVTVVKNLPDLTVAGFSLSGSSTLAAGQTVGPNLSATVSNNGIADAGQFAVGFYLSADATITTGDTLLVGGREFETGLAANGSLSVGIASVMQIPEDTESGAYYLGVIVDELGANEENDETNNTAAFAVTIVKNLPDLTVTGFSLSGSSTLAAGETVGPNLSATVSNNGIADAGQFAVGFYLSTDATITTGDTLLVGGREFETGLAANGSLSVGIASVMQIPSETEPGTYYLGVIVDELGANEENDETNNTAAFAVTVVKNLPDLTVTGFSLSGSSTLTVGETVGPSLSATVDNNGIADAGQFAVGFYLSTDATITTGDTLLVGGREFESGLAANSSLSVGIASVMQIPSEIEPGTYYLGVIVDELGANEENDETNNTAAFVVTIVGAGPDLQIAQFGLSGQNTVAAGQTIGPNLSATVVNTGNQDAGQFSLGFYLSTDATITTSDILLIGGREFEDGLEAGSSLSAGIASVMQIPTDIEPGVYFLGVIVDELSAIEEADETNNTAAVLVNVQSNLPDLTVASFTLAGENTIAGEQTIGPNLSATVLNTGNQDAGQFALGFYLSTDATITTSDILLIGGREFEDGLVAGGSLDVGIASVMQIPNGIEPGVYFLGVIVDELGAIEEADETNNTANILVSVQSNLPDLLIMSYYLSDSTLVAGQAMGSRLFVTAYNAGYAASDQFALGFYLSKDPIITTDDTLLTGGREFEDGLEPNASVDVGIASVMSVPAGTEPGTYFLGVIVDELDANAESDETNNTEIVLVTVVEDRADLAVTSFELAGGNALAAGQTIGPNLSVTVSNQGSVSADQFALGFYLSNDPFITTDDTLLVGGREFEDGLEAGGSLDVGIASVMAIPEDTAPGTYFLGVIVDELGAIDETDETNNTASIIVGIDQNLPDLTVAEFDLANGYAVAVGQAIGPRLSLSVRNDGFADSDQFAIGFYLSTDPIITTTDTLLLGGREFEDGLAVGASVDVGIASVMSVPESTEPGIYFLGVIVDELLANAETDESNNTASQLVTVTEALPDLTVTDFTIANGGVLPIGQAIGSRLSVTTENIGVVASGQFAIGFYLSNDPIITTDDTLLIGGREFEDGLEADASLNVGIASVMSVPEGTEPGVYFLGVIVDELGAIAEMDEANNTSVRTVTVGDTLPDLTVENFSLADGNELPIGQAIGPRLSLIVQNIGGAASDQIAIGFYLSTDAEITTDDVLLLGGREFESSIDQGGLRDVGIASVMTLPEGTETGNYFLGVIVDELDANTELDETNNTSVLPVVVTPEETGIDDWRMH